MSNFGKVMVLSPDGIPIEPKNYRTVASAQKALDKWIKRYEFQGYYSSNNGRIPLNELKNHCKIKKIC